MYNLLVSNLFFSLLLLLRVLRECARIGTIAGHRQTESRSEQLTNALCLLAVRGPKKELFTCFQQIIRRDFSAPLRHPFPPSRC